MATLIDGVGLHPKQLPRPVVNTTTFAPPATIPVTLGGSKPGVSISTKPHLSTVQHIRRPTQNRRSTFGHTPNDFSAMVVNPPSLLPADGLLFIDSPNICIPFPPIRSRSLSATSTERDRAVSKCSAHTPLASLTTWQYHRWQPVNRWQHHGWISCHRNFHPSHRTQGQLLIHLQVLARFTSLAAGSNFAIC